MDDVRAVDHRQKDHLTAKRQHTLLPVFGLAFTLLIDPRLRSDLGSILLLPIQAEEPDIGLHALAQLLIEDIVLAGVLRALDRLGVPARGGVLGG